MSEWAKLPKIFLVLPLVTSDNGQDIRPWKLMSGLMAFWFFVLLYMTSSLYQSCEKTENLERQLDRTKDDMNALTSQNKQLQAMAKELRYIMWGWGG